MKNWKKFFGMLGALICALGLNAMEFKSNPNVIAELEYFYAKDGTITGRRVNDSIQMYSYDKRGQLLAVIDGDGKPVRPATNGDSAKNQDAFFTGKPHIGELGYAFLFRNYRPEQGKWQTQDPISLVAVLPGHNHEKNTVENQLGYPNGWNNLAYVNNQPYTCVDTLGLECPYCGAITPSLFNHDSFYAMGRDDGILVSNFSIGVFVEITHSFVSVLNRSQIL